MPLATEWGNDLNVHHSGRVHTIHINVGLVIYGHSLNGHYI